MREISKRVKIIHKTLGLLDGEALAVDKGRYLVRVGEYRPTWVDKRYVSEADDDEVGGATTNHQQHAL